MEKIKIIITGGVLTPALAVIDELKEQVKWEIYYLGRRYSMEGDPTLSVESKVIPQKGVNFISFNPGRLQRRFTKYTVLSLLRIPVGLFQALIILRKIKPQVILSFGGYVSVPVVVAGWFLRIPVLTHEQTIVFGLASKINSFFARVVAVSFPQSRSYFPQKKVILTGNPLRKAIFKSQKPIWLKRNILNSKVIYITGGNQGSHLINQAVLEILPDLIAKYVIIHQTGEKDFSEILNQKMSEDQKFLGYFVLPYINDEEIGWVFDQADLVVSRAGANTISEMAALGKPAILIPIPWTYQDEQTKNARMLVDTGLAEMIPESNLSGKALLSKIDTMMSNLKKYKSGASLAQKSIKVDASRKIVDLVYAITQKKSQ